ALQAGDQQAAQFAQIAGGFRQVLEVDQLQAGQQFADLGLGQLILADLGTQAADVAELVVDAAPQHADAVAQAFAEAVHVLAQVGQVGIGGNVVALVTRLGVVGGQGAEGGQGGAGVGVDLPVAVVLQGLFQQGAHRAAQVQVGSRLRAVEN